MAGTPEPEHTRSRGRSTAIMSFQRPPRRTLLALLLAAGTAASVCLPASADEPLTATSVCEAQELKARLAKQPGLAVQIPAEFDKALALPRRVPLARRRVGRGAPGPEPADPVQPQAPRGPVQDRLPVLPLRHRPLARGRRAVGRAVHGLPRAVPGRVRPARGHPDPEAALGREAPIEWVQIHRLPEHVKFQHQAHVRAGFDCQTCHGPVETLDKLYLVPDTRWWQYGSADEEARNGLVRDVPSRQRCVARLPHLPLLRIHARDRSSRVS